MKDYFLKTSRVKLSTQNKSDFNEALELWENPNVTKFITATSKMSNDEVSQRLNIEIETYNVELFLFIQLFIRF